MVSLHTNKASSKELALFFDKNKVDYLSLNNCREVVLDNSTFFSE